MPLPSVPTAVWGQGATAGILQWLGEAEGMLSVGKREFIVSWVSTTAPQHFAREEFFSLIKRKCHN